MARSQSGKAWPGFFPFFPCCRAIDPRRYPSGPAVQTVPSKECVTCFVNGQKAPSRWCWKAYEEAGDPGHRVSKPDEYGAHRRARFFSAVTWPGLRRKLTDSLSKKNTAPVRARTGQADHRLRAAKCSGRCRQYGPSKFDYIHLPTAPLTCAGKRQKEISTSYFPLSARCFR